MTTLDTSALAAEFALGLLEGADLEDAERLYETDDAFRFEVDMLAGRLSSLDDTAAHETPSSALWSRIEGAIAA